MTLLFGSPAAAAPSPAAPPPGASSLGGGSGSVPRASSFWASTGAPSTAAPDASATTAATHDFGALLASSSSILPSVGSTNAPHTPALRKSLRELSVASSTLGAGTTTAAGGRPGLGGGTTGTYAAEAGAHRLLAREGGGFDSARLGRDARDLEVRASSRGAAAAGQQRYPSTPFGVRSGLSGGGPGVGGGSVGGGTGGGPPTPSRPGPASSAQGGGIGAFGGGVQPGRGESVESYLRRHQDDLVRCVLVKERAMAESDADDAVERRMAEDFKRERDALLKELAGHRPVAAPAAAPPAARGPATARRQQQSGVTLAAGGAPTPYLARRAAGAAQGQQTMPPQPAPHRGEPRGAPSPGSALSEPERRHAAIAGNLNAASARSRDRRQPTVDPDDLFAEFQALAEEGGGGSEFAQEDTRAAYANGWRLVRSMLRPRPSVRSQDDSSLEFQTRGRAIGALAHLCGQYRTFLVDAVKDAALSGRVGPSSTSSLRGGGGGGLGGLALDVATYVELESGRPSESVWPAVYHCLRCGDACAAFETLRTAPGTDGVEPPVTHLASLLSSYQSSSGGKSLWEGVPVGTSGAGTATAAPSADLDAAVPPDARRAVAELYHRTKTRSGAAAGGGGSSADRYKIAALALLSLSEPLSSTAGGVVRTIEDYLFANLWNAVQRNDDAVSGGREATGGGRGGGSCARAVAELGESLKHWGPSYFEGGRDAAGGGAAAAAVASSGGWAYATPLLAAQQFGSALSHLAEAGGRTGLLQSTHLGVAMDFAGAALRDLEKGSGDGGGGRGTGDAAGGAAQDKLFGLLLVSYANGFQNADPTAALEYLVRVPDEGSAPGTARIGSLAKAQVRRLILESRAFEALAGCVSPDGKREGGPRGGGGAPPALDLHFTPGEVSSILADAAGETLREGNVVDAVELLALAGHYGSLLSLLNREIASLLMVKEEDTERRSFWRQAAMNFHAQHLANGRTHVTNVLESEDSLHLGNTFQLLMNLTVFFDRVHSQEYQDAWLLLDNLNILPKSESDMAEKVEAFHSLDREVKGSFHHVVLGTMECLFRQHSDLKSRGVGGGAAGGRSASDSAAVEQRLGELRSRSRLLVTFAGLIHLTHSGDTNSRIARMDAYMV